MKITHITPYSLGYLASHDEKQTKINSNLKPVSLYSYPKEYYISFKGGMSLELEKTISQLHKNKAEFPPDIEKMALEELSKGNPKNKKLVDIHREKYKGLNDCDSLEEVKFFYPEFSEVKSIDEDKIPYIKGSLIDKFLNNEIKTNDGQLFLNPQKDLSLQLIQMYWGDCLSLTDITNACGHNFSSTMQKLNIPTMTPLYGQYLKLSDEDANKAITEAAARNRSLNENSIKRKGIPLTEEHKKKISEGLRRYHQEHPDIDFGRTEENAGYFLRNPYQSEVFSQVLLRAWNYNDARSIKKALARYMKKQDKEITEELFKNPAQTLILKDFWGKNQWARSKWSTCMTKSWERQKVLESMGLIYEPKKFFPILGRTYTEKIAQAIKTSIPYLSDTSLQDIKDILSVAVPSEKDRQPYNAYALRKLFVDAGPDIIKKNFDFPCYTVPTIIKSVFNHQIEKCEKKQYLSSESQKIVNSMKDIRDTVDFDLLEKYKENRTPDKLIKLFDMYVDMAVKCLTNDSKEIRDIFEITCNQCLDLKTKPNLKELEVAIKRLDEASTKESALVVKNFRNKKPD